MSAELDKYIKVVEKSIKDLKDLDCKDRLDLQAGIEDCLNHMNGSTIGWAKWIASPRIMRQFTDEELRNYFERMKKLALDFLELDIEATKLFIKKGEELAAKNKPENEESTKKKQSYVA